MVIRLKCSVSHSSKGFWPCLLAYLLLVPHPHQCALSDNAAKPGTFKIRSKSHLVPCLPSHFYSNCITYPLTNLSKLINMQNIHFLKILIFHPFRLQYTVVFLIYFILASGSVKNIRNVEQKNSAM